MVLTVPALTAFVLRIVSFILPVLIPSWRFFQSIEPSPRVEWAPVHDDADPQGRSDPQDWQAFRPCRDRVSPWQMVWSLVWNPARNRTLFIVSCAERIQQGPTDHSIGVIQRAIRSDLQDGLDAATTGQLRFRLVFVHREGRDLVREVIFVSDPFPVGGKDVV